MSYFPIIHTWYSTFLNKRELLHLDYARVKHIEEKHCLTPIKRIKNKLRLTKHGWSDELEMGRAGSTNTGAACA